MSERKPRELLLLCLVVLTLTGLCIWPATRRLVHQQVIKPLLPPVMSNPAADAQRVADENPRDYATQLAFALTMPVPQHEQINSVQRLHELAARFPNEPSLYAHTLRYASYWTIILHRPEQEELYADPSSSSPTEPKFAAPKSLAAYDSDAADGERLDPDNAYFPLMRAVGLYEAHRDVEAIAALHRAGQKTRYEDYANSEFGVLDTFYTKAYGRQNAMARMATQACIIFPHYSQIRALARMGIVSAVHAELGGNKEEGFAIRRDVMRTGALMRVQGL